ncbi:hypothetical protein SASPL_150087 [Salvia splendens]|uniref:Uncharacterized protein n=1 Tax=Salvia splendens TaxID=180675 RepID=A0A8X8W5Y1_SALSN|nr:hypothetical protein SASPL_150087 [Salvia splendens]
MEFGVSFEKQNPAPISWECLLSSKKQLLSCLMLFVSYSSSRLKFSAVATKCSTEVPRDKFCAETVDSLQPECFCKCRWRAVIHFGSMGNSVGSVFSGVGHVVGNIFGHPLDFLSGKACNKKAPVLNWEMKRFIPVQNRNHEFTCSAGYSSSLSIYARFCQFRSRIIPFLSMYTNMGFHLLHRKLLRGTVVEVCDGCNLGLLRLGICQCICRTLCRIIWCFFSSYFSALHCCCSYFCLKLQSVKQNRRRRDVEAPSSSSSSSSSRRSSSVGEDEGGEMSTFGPRRNMECKRSELSKRKRYKEEHLKRSLRANSHRAGVEVSGNSRRLSRMKNVDDHIRVTKNSKFARKVSRNGARPRRGRPSPMLESRVTE